MEDFGASVIMVAIAGVLLFVVGFLGFGFFLLEENPVEQWAMERKCEKDLPRAQHCIMKFVPAKQDQGR